ncbi:30S ribosomal protein S14 [Rickettsiales endosymbiont of Stachyamoeba lipophora]|uniref:30S ribosomal protein S14 n=1 Tax=Rickettsiales endosymbiont of Stachyamoeba lipophora TaxID=2486578 RepID=UPI000F64B523|nr:30S ribosomal protein S14 [Rickettsiales endosymbiont of Stachyamoeba lipophora]AZL15877.1 30S ribosomal protein S14 [Rickettsiales endosymbiont of Stachyamoeba lipophora]
MAKRSAIQKNNKRKKLSNGQFLKRQNLQQQCKDENLPLSERFEAAQKLAELPRDGSYIRVRNRCEITGRPRGFYRDFKMSRIALRSLANLGLLTGVKKASW